MASQALVSWESKKCSGFRLGPLLRPLILYHSGWSCVSSPSIFLMPVPRLRETECDTHAVVARLKFMMWLVNPRLNHGIASGTEER